MKSLATTLSLYLAVASVPALGLTACAVDPGENDELIVDDVVDVDDEGDKADRADLAITPFADDIGSRGETVTRRVFKTRAAYKSYFGHYPPASVDFSTHWVAFYSAGIKNHGGFTAEVARIRLSNSGLTLKVSTELTSPGFDCAVPQVITKPHVLVKFTRPSPAPTYVSSTHTDDVRNCSDPTPLLTYSFGNQAHGSILEIGPDGSVRRTERTGPVTWTDIPMPPLTASQLGTLRTRIDQAAHGTVHESSYTSALGAHYGNLSAYDGTESGIVREYAIGVQRVNDAAAADLLVDYVNAVVDIDMP